MTHRVIFCPSLLKVLSVFREHNKDIFQGDRPSDILLQRACKLTERSSNHCLYGLRSRYSPSWTFLTETTIAVKRTLPLVIKAENCVNGAKNGVGWYRQIFLSTVMDKAKERRATWLKIPLKERGAFRRFWKTEGTRRLGFDHPSESLFYYCTWIRRHFHRKVPLHNIYDLSQTYFIFMIWSLLTTTSMSSIQFVNINNWRRLTVSNI